MSADMKSPPGGDAEGAKVAEQNASRSDCGHRNSSPAPWSWLSTDRPELARPEFVAQVLFGQLAPDELVDCCELFRFRWGTPALIAALQCGHRQAPLPDAARQLLVAYTAEAAA